LPLTLTLSPQAERGDVPSVALEKDGDGVILRPSPRRDGEKVAAAG